MSEDLEVLLTTARRREHALAAVLSAVTSGNDLQTVLVDIAAAASDLFRAMSAGVFVLEGDEIGMYAEFATPDGELRHRGRFARPNVRTSSLAEVLRERSVIRFDDQSMLGDEYAQSRDAAAALGIKSSVYVPVPIGGAAVGMCVFRDEVDPFTDDDVALLQSFAAQAAHAVESARRADELRESLALQTATSEVLRLISANPGDLRAVFQGIVEQAAQLCDAQGGSVQRFVGDELEFVAHNLPGAQQMVGTRVPVGFLTEASGPTFIDDLHELMEVTSPARSLLSVVLVNGDQIFGRLMVSRFEVRPFEERHGSILQSFADQAAVAIANANLFNDLGESLELQTATSEVLRLVGDHPGDLATVARGLLARAATLAAADRAMLNRIVDGRATCVAVHGPESIDDLVGAQWTATRSFVDAGARDAVVFVEDMAVHEISDDYHGPIIGSLMSIPVYVRDEYFGQLTLSRDDCRSFDVADGHVLQSFAQQAAVAIANARLFNDLGESLELQTATSEVLRLISAHPGDLHAVMHGLVERAVRLVDGDTGAVARFDGDTLTYLLDTTQPDFAGVRSPLSRGFRDAVLAGSAGPVRIDDAQALVGVGGLTHEVVRDVRSSLVAPLYADGQPFGMLLIGRLEVRPFDERDGEVLQTFAEQAAIAISNARLFNDLDAALTRQTANTEILRVISTSPGDLGRTLPEIHRAAMALVDVSHLAITYGDDHSFTAWDRQRGLSDFAARERLGSDLIVDQTHTSGVPTQLVGPVEEWRAQNPFVAQRAVEGGITNGATLFVPMAGSLGKWGFLIAQRAEPVAFDDDEIALLQEFAAQAVIALDNAELFTALETRNRDLAESLSLQTATSEVLTLISANPGDLRVVLDGIAARAGALCGATVGGVLLLRGDVMRFEGAWAQSGDRESIFGREVPVALAGVNLKARDQRSPVFVDDFAAFMRKRNDPIGMSYIEEYTVGSFVTIALFRDDTWIGNLNLNRTEVDPFDPKVGPILQSFADQAVLAIQNAGLFGDLERALELQTATSEVLRLISDNPGDLQAVFDGIVEQAARLCDADSANIGRRDGDEIVLVATSVAANKPIVGLRVPMPPDVDVTNPAYVHDVAALDGSPAMPHQIRSALSVPLRVDDDHFGWINVNRFEVRPFDERHGAIVQRFAEQAAIAIANAKLFTDLDESLELQTAIAEVLEIISSSPTELEPVLNQVLGIAARLCDADVGLVWQRGEGRYVVGANHGLSAEQVAGANDSNFELGVPHVVELVTEGQLLRFDLDMHEYLRTGEVPDGFTRPSGPRGSGDDRTRRPGLEFAGHVPANAYLMVPLTRPGSFAGVFSLMRWDRRPFTERDEAIVQTFADQALIAIENSRLFHELEESNRDVRIALEQQTAVGAVLQTISRSAFDLGTVLEELSRQATLLVGGREAAIIVVDTGEMTVFPPEIIRADGSIAPEFNGWRDPDAVAFFVERGRPHYAGYPTGEAAEAAGPVAVRHFEVHGVNSIATLPLLQGNRVVGLLAVLRLGLARFSDAEKRLLQTFADQAVIAIENARLFRELEERNREVSEALEQQTASAEVMRVIGMSPGDISTTLPAIAGAARRLCDADYASIGFLEGRSWQFWSDVDGLISLDNGGDLVAASRARPTRPTVRSMSEDRSTRGKASTR